jgi:2-polyprenyl-6-methoxyphenol hydroxylase-like FAD-dependent oxidoreductase
LSQQASVIETPVLIVGGGPIGLALAADLGRREVEALLVEGARQQAPAGAITLIDTVRGAGPRIAARRSDASLTEIP